MSYEELWHPLVGIYEAGEAKAVMRLVLEQRFGLSLADILSGQLEALSVDDCLQLRHISNRLLTGEPVQYVLGEAMFCGRMFHVEPGVLIPRPETEELCRWIVAEEGRLSEKCSTILDIGTGSGCIACTLATEFPDAGVTAWDLSADALRIARENAKRTHVHVSFVQADALRPASAAPHWNCIVSNPPYVCQSERGAMERVVLDYEPPMALFVPDDDPLLFYRSIARHAVLTLKPSGSLYFEINPLYATRLTVLLESLGLRQVTVREDFMGKQRFVKACK